jgi:hypothetical protein
MAVLVRGSAGPMKVPRTAVVGANSWLDRAAGRLHAMHHGFA